MKKSMTITKLTEIRGIGDAVASKLIDHYGSEQVALKTIFEGKIFSLIDAGLSEKIALKVVRSYKNAITGDDNDDSLQTSDINQINSKLIKMLQSYAMTAYGKSKILVDFYPSRSKEKIAQNRDIFQTSLKIIDLNKPKLDSILANFTNFQPLEVNNDFEVKRRTVLTTIPEAMKTLKGLKIPIYCNLELIRSFEELQNYILTDELILLLTEHDFDD